ncbi:MAG: biopolymer transporter ExbD [Planctomycetota bacterium]|nr:MAG: biopolymer transporter ExbD [Planctomycetota bacterium]
MRIPSSHHDAAGRTDATMTPMIDVVFLLLIFFICTASFQLSEYLLPSSVRVEPGAGTVEVEVRPEMEDLQEVVIEVDYRGGAPTWVVNDQPVASLARLRQMLVAVAEVDRAVPVILDVTEVVPLGDVIDVYDVARLTGFDQIQFAAAV